MKLQQKIIKIILNTIPIVAMIGLIPIVQNDYWLTLIYMVVITIALLIKYEPKDLVFFALGFFIMIGSEAFFVSTGVEQFNRRTLFGLMPIWLPFIWGYSFMVMKRTVYVLDDKK